jgi:hypothetical protein
MKARPILFSGPMVRALLDGSKTQTRRVVKPVGAHHLFQFRGEDEARGADEPTGEWAWCRAEHVVSDHIRCPFGKPGDRLWVRETWAIECLGRIGTSEGYDCSYELEYRADGATHEFECPPGTDDSAYLRAYDRMRGDWWPSIHMPRWASRIALEVTGVRVERLQEISETDAFAEGVDNTMCAKAVSRAPSRATLLPMTVHGFAHLWNSLAAPGADWQSNPWVWVVEFKRVT